MTSSKTEIVLEDVTCDYLHVTLLEYLEDNTPSKWADYFRKQETRKILAEISDSLIMETRESRLVVYPPIDNIFRALYLTAPSDVRVCILGMDPYHNPGSATGLAFDVPSGHKLNPSLINIRKEVANCGYQTTPGNGNLGHWVEQGVLLLNTSLTVVKGTPGSHIAMWSEFTRTLLKFLTDKRVMVFLLLGRKAQEYRKYLPTNQIVVATGHPSPLAANAGFLGSKCFDQVNVALLKLGKEEIDWTI